MTKALLYSSTEVVKIKLEKVDRKSGTVRLKLRIRGENYWRFYDLILIEGQSIIVTDNQPYDEVPIDSGLAMLERGASDPVVEALT